MRDLAYPEESKWNSQHSDQFHMYACVTDHPFSLLYLPPSFPSLSSYSPSPPPPSLLSTSLSERKEPAGGQKKEVAAASPRAVDVSRLDLRIGHVVSAEKVLLVIFV